MSDASGSFKTSFKAMKGNGRILMISSEFPPGPGGIGYHAFSLAKAIHGQGRPVSVITNGDYAEDSRIAEFDAAQPFVIRRFARKGLLTPFLRAIDTVRLLSEVRPSHVIATGRFPIWMLPIVALHPSRPKRHVIIHGHETIMGSRAARMSTRLSIRLSDFIYPVSHFAAEKLPGEWKDRRNVHIVPNGIEVDALKAYPREEGERALDGNPVLLTVGHSSPRKGQHRVIKAMPSILKVHPDAVYHIIGRDVNNRRLRHLAERLGVSNAVRFHPPVFPHTKLGAIYSSADAFMLLSENQPNGDVEGFGIVAIEANFFGTPVIGAKGCGVEDAVSHLHSGCLVDGDDVEEIAKAVTHLMVHPEMRISAATWALRHNWPDIVKSFLPHMS